MKSEPIILKWSANFGKKSFCKNNSQFNFNNFLFNYQWVMNGLVVKEHCLYNSANAVALAEKW